MSLPAWEGFGESLGRCLSAVPADVEVLGNCSRMICASDIMLA
jgi:hypothetical protein